MDITHPLLTFVRLSYCNWNKGKSAYRWHFQYHLPTSSCQRSLWTTPRAGKLLSNTKHDWWATLSCYMSLSFLIKAYNSSMTPFILPNKTYLHCPVLVDFAIYPKGFSKYRRNIINHNQIQVNDFQNDSFVWTLLNFEQIILHDLKVWTKGTC